MSISGIPDEVNPTEDSDIDIENAADYDNPDGAQQVRAALVEKKNERQEEASEAKRAAQKISERQSEKTVHIRVNGERVPFNVLGGALNDVEDTIFDLRGKDEEDLTPEEVQQEKQAMERLDRILAEKCKWEDESLDVFTYGWWREQFNREERQEFVGDLHDGGIEGKNR